MSLPSEQLAQLEIKFPGTLEFVRHCPYGLVGEHHMDSDVAIESNGKYCVISWNAEASIISLLPGLYRLSEVVLNNLGLESTANTTTYREELIWFYAFARATTTARIKTNPMQLVAPGISMRWNAIASELCGKENLDEFDLLRASIIIGYGAPGATLLQSREHPVFRKAWRLALQAQDFSSFYEGYQSIGGPRYKTSTTGSFTRMQPPKKRIALHTCHGRTSGIIATTRVPWTSEPQKIEKLRKFMLSRPLMFENHDLDRPVALLTNPHIIQAKDEHLELHGECLVIDKSHWERRATFKGFSVGIQHE